MDQASFHEYRCTCGKLLFKGLLLLSVVEAKCNRCGTVRLIHEINEDLIGPTSFGLLLDQNGKIVNVCSNTTSVIGWSASELLSMSLSDINTSVTLSFYHRLWTSRHTMLPYGWREKTFYRSKEGGVITLSTQFKFMEVGGAHYFFIILDKRIAGTAFMELNSDGIWFGKEANEIMLETDENGYCTSVDKNFMTIFGYSPLDIVGKLLSDFCPSLVGIKSDTRTLCIRNEGKPFDILHNTFTHHDGQQIPLDSYFMCNYTEGKFSGYRIFNWLENAVTV